LDRARAALAAISLGLSSANPKEGVVEVLEHAALEIERDVVLSFHPKHIQID
jgi:hypothetical protein